MTVLADEDLARTSPARPTIVHNPLPARLRHYERALADTLAGAGVTDLARAPTASVEVGSAGMATRLRRGVRALRAQRRLLRGDRAVIACWPTFGLIEPLVWRRLGPQAHVTIVVHDPTPLGRQFGVGRLWARLGARAIGRGRVDVVVHSEPARDSLVAAGWPRARVLPIPVAAPSSRPPVGDRRPRVSVLGAWKPARDLGLLRDLAPLLEAEGLGAVIAGPGWPAVPGWDVRDEFLSEDELEAQIATSACVLVPYARFFQSDIAVRALELGTPVVGPRHPFLEDLLGPSWPGLVPAGHGDRRLWLEAIRAVQAVSPATLGHLHATYARRCVAAWRDLAGGSGGAA